VHVIFAECGSSQMCRHHAQSLMPDSSDTLEMRFADWRRTPPNGRAAAWVDGRHASQSIGTQVPTLRTDPFLAVFEALRLATSDVPSSGCHGRRRYRSLDGAPSGIPMRPRDSIIHRRKDGRTARAPGVRQAGLRSHAIRRAGQCGTTHA